VWLVQYKNMTTFKNIHSWVEHRVTLHPDRPAVAFGEISLSYRELNDRANRIASVILSSGPVKGGYVGICLERSTDLMAAILAVLKTGAAYVPFDVEYPAERLQYMASLSRIPVMITSSTLQQRLPEGNYRVVNVDDIANDTTSVNPDSETGPDAAAYVLFTSGSTGQPKGCLLEHHSLLNRLQWMQHAYSLGSEDVILQKTPFTFDVSVWELFWWLMYGAKMCLLEQDAEKDPDEIVRAVEKNQVTVIHFVPSMLTVFLDFLESQPESIKQLRSLKQIFTSGEALLGYHVRRLRDLLPEVKLMNLYGPTEASIDVSYYDCANWDGVTEEIPIGRPVYHTGLLILDSQKHILPPGSVGEIAIGGVGLARGYLNRPDLTRQKFINHPTASDQKIYLTGDLGRWNVSGQLEYLGRIDDQVKIRGNRIELGEITSKMLSHDGVKESVVIAKKIHSSTHLELVAYVVGTTDFAQLKKYLSDNLPSYMVPTYYVSLDRIPLSSSGKVNRKLLPDPENTGLDVSQYVAPATAMEVALAEVWASVLQKNLGTIGLESDFFDLGGDSIKAIQVVSKLRAQGLSLRLADVISVTILAEQARSIQKTIREISQQPVLGSFSLSPIQHLFLNSGFMDGDTDDKSYFNQSHVFNLPEWVSLEMLITVWDKLTLHHDALRLRFKYAENSWIQEYAAPGSHNYRIHSFDLTASDSDSLPESIILLSERVKKENHLHNGPLVNLGYFRCQDCDRLMVTIHHLVVDMVSWQIIREDFNTLLLQLNENRYPELPLKTDSYKDWILAHHTADYRQITLTGRIFWDGLNMSGTKMLVSENTPRYPVATWKDYEKICHTVSQSRFVDIARKKKSSKADTLLLYALSKALNKTFGEGVYACYAETHGRIDSGLDLDVTRTVGWFTDMYPVLLNTRTGMANTEEFLSFHDEVYQQMELNKSFLWNYFLQGISDPRPDGLDFVEFNFLGEISNKQDLQMGALKESKLKSGAESGENLTPKAQIIVVSGFFNGYLQFNVSASAKCFSSDRMNKLLDELENSAAELISQLINTDTSLKSAVDFTYSKLTYNEIKTLEQQYGELEDLYALSPMQKGLYYLGMYNENNQSYCVQFGEKYKGKLNVDFFRESIAETISSNPSLKAIFRSDIGKDTLQIIPKESEVDFEYIDLSANKESNLVARCLACATDERSRPFDFSKGKLLRTKLFKLEEDMYYFLWTNHHIILDGWSTGILLAEIRKRYNRKLANLPYLLEAKPLFSNYIKWLGQQNESQSIQFWKQKLYGYTTAADIKAAEVLTENSANFYTVDYLFNLSEELTQGLEQKARKLKTTLNTIMQAAYGLLLSYYCKSHDIVFGAIVSGRPAQIPDIQKMVGLLFNTIPLRVRFGNNSKLTDLLSDIQKYFIESQDHHYLNVADFNKLGLAVRNPIRTLLTFENYPTEQINDDDYVIADEDKFIFEQTNYDLSTIIIPGRELRFIIKYNPLKYGSSQIDELHTLWEFILDLMARNEDLNIKEAKVKIENKIAEKEKEETERQKNLNLSKLKKFKK